MEGESPTVSIKSEHSKTQDYAETTLENVVKDDTESNSLTINKEDTKSCTIAPPDGGYGWVVVAAAFVGHGFILYNTRAVGVLLLDLKYEYQVSYANLNIIFSLLVGCMYIAAPIVSMFGNKFGSRATTILGGFLHFLGLSLAAFSPSIAFTHITLGLITGLGMSFSAIPLSVEVGRYFSKRRSLALGVQQMGPSLFQMISPPITQYLNEKFGWRGALLITGALNFNVVACGAVLRPIRLESDKDASDKEGKKKLFDAGILKSKKFILNTVTMAILGPALYLMFYYVVAFAVSEQGFTEYGAAFMVTLSSVFGLFARVVTGVIESYTRFTCFTMMTFLSAVTALCYLTYPFLTSYWSSAINLAVFAFAIGGLSPMMISGLTDIVGPSKLMSGLGIHGITGAAAAMLMQPFVGWLSDIFGSLRIVMWLGFILMSISTILLLLYCFIFHKFLKPPKKKENP